MTMGRLCFIMCPLAVLALREQRKIKNAVFCEQSFGFRPYLTYKDVDRFRNGSVKGNDMSKSRDN